MKLKLRAGLTHASNEDGPSDATKEAESWGFNSLGRTLRVQLFFAPFFFFLLPFFFLSLFGV